MKNIYLFLFFLCFSRSMSAQVWIAQNVGLIVRLQMFNVSAPDSRTVWVSGFIGSFHVQPWSYIDGNTSLSRSTDGGLTWQQSTINAGAGGSITSLYALDSLTAWATCINNGRGGKVFKTTNGGESWIYQPSAAFTQFVTLGYSYADWIYFWDANEGICLGDPVINNVFELFRTTNGGNNWVKLNTVIGQTNEIGFNEIYQVSGDTIWFGTSKGRIFRSTNRGQNWQIFSSGHSIIDALAFSKGKGIGIAFANSFTTSYASMMTLTTNGGENWSTPITTSFSNQAVFDATIVPETDYIVVTTRSDNANGPFNTYLSRDKGANWTQIDNQAPITRVRFVNPRVGYGGGHKNSFFGTTTLYRYTGSALTGLLTPSVLDAQINLSPNPTTDQLNIQLTYKEASSFRLNINNLLGELVYFEDFKDVSQINKSLNIKHLASGTYIVTIANPTGSLSRKILKTE